jgi:hypothetical protein
VQLRVNVSPVADPKDQNNKALFTNIADQPDVNDSIAPQILQVASEWFSEPAWILRSGYALAKIA